ncbi:MAG TPA: phosphohistidine phosphatase SixA [Verrucomicrobiae bacterium]|nr:phosphohistidine phosphatase SixA [Verrucomicrobiae bacterium]
MADLYLLRHAEAASHKDPRYRNDSERPLTEDGAARMRRAAAGMLKLRLSFDRILTSPLVRAKETAEIVAEILGERDRLAVEEAMAAGARWDKIRKVLAAGSAKYADSVLLVGHEPDLSNMAGQILDLGRGSVLFKKGTLARISVDAIPPREPGSLAFLMTIDHLAAAGG